MRNPLVTMLVQVAEERGYAPALLISQAWADSRLTPCANPTEGDVGLFRLSPVMVARYHIDPLNPRESARAAVAIMQTMLTVFQGDARKALVAYKWGSKAVLEAVDELGKEWLSLFPIHTQAYVEEVTLDALLVSDLL